MTEQRQRYSRLQQRGQQLLIGATLLLIVGFGSDLKAQMQCNAGGRGGGGAQPRGGQMAGRVPSFGGAMNGGGGVNQFAQMMQMMQQLQQLQRMQQQAAMLQQMRERQGFPSPQRAQQTVGLTATSVTTNQSATIQKPTMSRRERLRALIQQRREEQSQGRPSRRELALQRSARNRADTLAAPVSSSFANITN